MRRSVRLENATTSQFALHPKWLRAIGVWTCGALSALAMVFAVSSLGVAWLGGQQIAAIISPMKLGASNPGFDAFLGGVVGVGYAAVKMLLPLQFVWFGREPPGLFMRVALWVVCLLLVWMTALLAADQLLPWATLPIPLLVFLALALAAFEIVASLLPAVALALAATTSQIRVPTVPPAKVARERDHESASLLHFADVLELIEQIVKERQVPAGLRGIVTLSLDGVIVTTQSSLARALGQNKGVLNRRLYQLKAMGRISLTTSSRDTRIALVDRVTSQIEL